MTIKQAKTIPLAAFLDKLGYVPDVTKKQGNDIWYKSPLRPDEKTASFHINTQKNAWFDFSLSKGGSIIDFVKHLNNCDEKTALDFIQQSTLEPLKITSEPQKEILKPQAREMHNEAFKLDEIRRHFSPSLVTYMKEQRKINTAAIGDFAVEVHFSDQKGKKFFGLGMKNISEGYEVRNPYFKGSIGKKDVIFIKGTSQKGLSIFEGMFDFFSAITFFSKTVLLKNDILILNSVVFEQQAIDFIRQHPEYQNLSLFLDNDAAGQLTAQNIKIAFPERIIEPSFALYLPHKDFNDFLVSNWTK
jgi:hypothetical protein